MSLTESMFSRYWPSVGDLVSYDGNEWRILSSNRGTETVRLKLLHTKENVEIVAMWDNISPLVFEDVEW